MKAWILALASISTAANAAPTYLACSLEQETRVLPVDVTLDETEQRAIVTLPSTGRSVTLRALFSPIEVRIPDDESTWIVDRVKLAFHRVMVIGDRRWDEPGKCSIKPAPAKRAF